MTNWLWCSNIKISLEFWISFFISQFYKHPTIQIRNKTCYFTIPQNSYNHVSYKLHLAIQTSEHNNAGRVQLNSTVVTFARETQRVYRFNLNICSAEIRYHGRDPFQHDYYMVHMICTERYIVTASISSLHMIVSLV